MVNAELGQGIDYGVDQGRRSSDRRVAGVRGRFALADMTTIRGGRRRRGEMPGFGTAGFESRRQFARIEGGARDRLERDVAVGPGNRELAVFEDDVGFRRFEPM